MAGMFYSLKEVTEKLGKSEDEVRQLVKAGRLREFRDGPNLLFKVDEVATLMGDTGSMTIKKEGEKPAAPQKELEAETEEILLAPETPAKAGEELELSDADTAIVEEGIKVLGDTDAASTTEAAGEETFKGLRESPATPAKEASLEEIEDDVNLDLTGSGSGLLDLSLQADDTSLGGILDEIYTPGGEGKPAAAEPEPAAGAAMEVAAEADQMLSAEQFPEPQIMAPAGAAYVEPPPDAMSNSLGIMLFIPLLAVIYTAIVAIAGISNVTPAILKSIQGMIWYVAIGLAVASGVIAGAGATMGGEKKPRTPKPPKAKKEKAPKPKKKKKGEEAPPPEPEETPA